MDIGPTGLPILPVQPGEGIRRVEGRSDAQQSPERQHAHDETTDGNEQESPHDSVEVSPDYLMAHLTEAPAGDEDGVPLSVELPKAQLDIEA